MGVAIVFGGVVVAHDGDLNGQRVDLHPAVGYHELHVRKVRVRVAELTFRQTHVLRTNLSSRCSRIAREREVCFLIQRVIDVH